MTWLPVQRDHLGRRTTGPATAWQGALSAYKGGRAVKHGRTLAAPSVRRGRTKRREFHQLGQVRPALACGSRQHVTARSAARRRVITVITARRWIYPRHAHVGRVGSTPG